MSGINNDEMLKLENQLCFPLYAASRQVISLYTPYLKELGLTYTQYLVFLALWENDGLTVGELGRRLYLDNGTLSPLLKKLETEGYLTRSREKSDERIVTVVLTEKGAKLKEKARDIPLQIASCIRLSEYEARELHKILYHLLKGAE